MLTLLHNIDTCKFVIKLLHAVDCFVDLAANCILLAHSDAVSVLCWTLYAWEANNQEGGNVAWWDRRKGHAEATHTWGNEECPPELFVTGHVSDLPCHVHQPAGHRGNSPEIQDSVRHKQTTVSIIHLQCIIRCNTSGVSSSRRCTVHRLLYENSDTRHSIFCRIQQWGSKR